MRATEAKRFHINYNIQSTHTRTMLISYTQKSPCSRLSLHRSLCIHVDFDGVLRRAKLNLIFFIFSSLHTNFTYFLHGCASKILGKFLMFHIYGWMAEVYPTQTIYSISKYFQLPEQQPWYTYTFNFFCLNRKFVRPLNDLSHIFLKPLHMEQVSPSTSHTFPSEIKCKFPGAIFHQFVRKPFLLTFVRTLLPHDFHARVLFYFIFSFFGDKAMYD